MTATESADAPALANPALHLPAAAINPPTVAIPDGKRISFGWASFAVVPSAEPVLLEWNQQKPLPPGDAWLRLTIALDLRENLVLQVRHPGETEEFTSIDLSQLPAFQMVEVQLSRQDAERALAEGLQLSIGGGQDPVHFFAHSPDSEAPQILRPHLMVAADTDRWGEFLDRALSLDTVQAFGWMEGSILAGLWDYGTAFPNSPARSVLKQRLDLFFVGPHGNTLSYEGPKSEIVTNAIDGIEATLPFATLAQARPSHPQLQTAVNFWLAHIRPDDVFAAGSIQDWISVTAEGSYTVAWPLLLIGLQRQDKELQDLALEQIRIRVRYLVDHSGDIWLRNAEERRTFRNWARGITWYYLGLMKCLIAAQQEYPDDELHDLRAEAVRVMEHVLEWQRDDGLWGNFIDRPDTLVDTSGSAGIAAALALGWKHGLLPDKAKHAAERTLKGLENYLTPDGLLAHGTPSNRGGAAEGDRRAIFPVGMGFTLQLLAALGIEHPQSTCN